MEDINFLHVLVYFLHRQRHPTNLLSHTYLLSCFCSKHELDLLGAQAHKVDGHMRSIMDPHSFPHHRLFLSPSCAASHDSGGCFPVASGGLMGHRKNKYDSHNNYFFCDLERCLIARPRAGGDLWINHYTVGPLLSSQCSDITVWPVMTVIKWSRGDSATLALCTGLLAFINTVNSDNAGVA